MIMKMINSEDKEKWLKETYDSLQKENKYDDVKLDYIMLYELHKEEHKEIERLKEEIIRLKVEKKSLLNTHYGMKVSNELKSNIRFLLDGCDISFIAEAPEDITLKQLLKQCDKIKPKWCSCGICSLNEDYEEMKTEIIIDYDSIKKTNDDVSCDIVEDSNE